MKKIDFLICFCLFLTASFPVDAYELATHANLAEKAYQASILGKDQQFLGDLGLDPVDPNAFGEVYYDITLLGARERRQNDFERLRMPNEGRDFLTIQGWLMRGAIREDDLGEILGFQVGGDPHDDPDGNIFRVFNHFYDPVHDRPLTTCFVEPGTRNAPDWAIGSTDAFREPNTPELFRRNHFTVFDAREAMYRALTGQDGNNKPIATTVEERNKYWATTFRSLGDVVHLIQDMAQPQHTRNDGHAGKGPCTGHKAVYELYIEARATGAPAKQQETQQLDPTIRIFPPLNFNLPGGGPYPTARFTKYSDFFSTAMRDTLEGGLGLADYSNRGFFSAGTNIGDDSNDYLLPPNDPDPFARLDIEDTQERKTAYLLDAVFDSLNPALRHLDVRKTTESMWFEFIPRVGQVVRHGYTLTQVNYDDMADLLIPRAVAYGAGVIDYFFRGRLEAVDAEFTDTGVSLKVRNAIDKDRFPEWANEVLHSQDSQGNPGRFVLTVQYKQGPVEQFDTSPLVSFVELETIAPGGTSTQTLSFELPAPPDDATEVEYRLVFRGRLGEEDDAVAVGTIKPLGGFLVQPSYVPNDGISGTRLIEKIRGEWRLTTDEGLVAGNIDWRGFVNGKPTKVLSWFGPKARYFPDPGRRSPFESEIFQNGERFAVAPCAVLGAAITKDPESKEWLVVICGFGSMEVVFVYRRPNKKSDSDALFDPVTNPDGWQEIGRFVGESDFKPTNRPWFFNGAGTVAQTMREDDTDLRNGLTRLKITVTGNTASIESLGNLEGRIFTRSSTGLIAEFVNTDTPACTEDYTVVDDQDISFGDNASGSYVVAVDYKDNQEVLATINHSFDKRSTGSFDRTNENSIECGGDNLVDLQTGVVVSRRESNNTQDSTTTLSFGTTQIVLNTNTFNRKAVVMFDSFTVLDSRNPANNQFINSTTNTYTSRDETEQTNIIYLDMRNDLIVLRSNRSTTTDAGGGEDTVWTVTSQNTTEEKVEIRWPQGTIPVFNSKRSSTRDFPEGFIPSFVFLGGLPFEIQFDPSSMSGFAGVQDNQGVWAVSNGNLLVSQEYEGENSETKHFNFLTDGNLEALIPGAPPDAHYFPGGVVK